METGITTKGIPVSATTLHVALSQANAEKEAVQSAAISAVKTAMGQKSVAERETQEARKAESSALQIAKRDRGEARRHKATILRKDRAIDRLNKALSKTESALAIAEKAVSALPKLVGYALRHGPQCPTCGQAGEEAFRLLADGLTLEQADQAMRVCGNFGSYAIQAGWDSRAHGIMASRHRQAKETAGKS